jgi:hypothetical protein
MVTSVGAGKNTPLWEARWLNGVSPNELAPNIYMQACYKYITVYKALQQLNWIQNLKWIDMEELLDEFTLLFSTLNDIHLTKEKCHFLEVD